MKETMTITAWNALTGEPETLTVPIIGYVSVNDNAGNTKLLPTLGLKMMSDERWNELCDQQEARNAQRRRSPGGAA